MHVDRNSMLQDWVLWLLANIVGNVFWICLGAVPLVIFGDRDNIVSGILFVCLQGAMTGLAQWLFVIRWHVRRAGGWILATAIGPPAGVLVGAALVSAALAPIANLIDHSALIVGLILGASFGLAQWLVLRDKVLYAYWWILANIGIWGLSMAVGAQLPFSSDVLVAWAVAEALRGGVLVWLLRRPMPERVSSDEAPLPAGS